VISIKKAIILLREDVYQKLKAENGFREGSKILFREREELGEVSERGAVEYLMRKTVCIAQLLENFRFQRLR